MIWMNKARSCLGLFTLVRQRKSLPDEEPLPEPIVSALTRVRCMGPAGLDTTAVIQAILLQLDQAVGL
jgi:hypothetical protein